MGEQGERQSVIRDSRTAARRKLRREDKLADQLAKEAACDYSLQTCFNKIPKSEIVHLEVRSP